MKDRYLLVTYRRGRPLAAYLHLPHKSDQTCSRSAVVSAGLIVDYTAEGAPIGVEIAAPQYVSAEQLDAVLLLLGEQPIEQGDRQLLLSWPTTT